MNNYTMKTVKSAVILASAALVPTAVVFMSGGVSNVIAATTTQNVTVSANIANTCKLSTPVDVAFGTYDGIDVNASTPLDATGGFSIKCTNKTSADMSISLGVNFASAVTVTRAMKGATTATEFLSYDLYQDAGRATYWGPLVADDKNYTAANGNTVAQVIYGRIPAGQSTQSAQNYSDVVVVTATF